MNSHLSDLFFNRDLSTCKKRDDKGLFSGFITAQLLAEADDMRGCLSALGVQDLPTSGAIVDDFLRRV